MAEDKEEAKWRERGAGGEGLCSGAFYKWVRVLLLLVAAWRRVPQSWNRALACFLGKGNGKPRGDGQRLVVLLCCMGALFFRHLLHEQLSWKEAPWAHGAVRGRRREVAMIVQKVISWRLSKGGWFHLTRFHDVKNGFWSLSHDLLKRVLAPPFVVGKKAAELAQARFTDATVTVDWGTRDATDLRVGEGGMPGDHAGPRYFNRGYGEVVGRAFSRYHSLGSNARLLIARCPISDKLVNVRLTLFVDDAAGKAIGRSGPEMVEEAELEQECLEGELLDVGAVANKEKQEHIIDGPSRDEVRRLYGLSLDGKPSVDSRYLGGRHTQNLGFTAERNRRILAARRG